MQMLERMLRVSQNPERISAESLQQQKFFEISLDSASDFDLPQALSLLSENKAMEDLALRGITLPTRERERRKRVEEIIKKGTDRISHFHPSNFPLSRSGEYYKMISYYTEIKPLDIISAFRGDMVQRGVEEKGIRDFYSVYGSNAILIYDASSENGLIQVNVNKFAFRNSQKKSEALLAIIAFS